MSLYEEKPVTAGDMQFLDLMRRHRQRARQLRENPMGYQRVGGAGLSAIAGMGSALAGDAERIAAARRSERVRNAIQNQQANVDNELLAERGRLVSALNVAKPFIQEGQRLFRRGVLRSDDDRFRDLYSPFDSSGDTDKAPRVRVPYKGGMG
jgi:hypothetical protein